jgi:hypothetical protein
LLPSSFLLEGCTGPPSDPNVTDLNIGNAASGRPCEKIHTSFHIFYVGGTNGTVDKPQEDEMFAMLTEIIHSQSAQGSFKQAGILDSVESSSKAAIAVQENNNTQSRSIDGGSKRSGLTTGEVVGVTFGAVAGALLALLFLLCCCCRRCCRSKKTDENANGKTDNDTDNSSEEEKKNEIANIFPLSSSADADKVDVADSFDDSQNKNQGPSGCCNACKIQ